MTAIFKKDFKTFFITPVGYVFIGAFSLIMNVMFFVGNVLTTNQSSEIMGLFATMLSVLGFLVPLLTMRLMSEELKLGTDQALLTAPISVGEVVFGKFFAAMGVFLWGLVLTLIYPLVVTLFGNPEPWAIIGNYVAIILAGGAYIAIGLFISSLTENQLISALVSFGVFLLLPVIDYLGFFGGSVVQEVVKYISFTSRYQTGFAMGIFSLWDAFYYLSVIAIFLFLTMRVLEKKRYS